MTTDNRTNELGKIRQNDAKHFAWSEAQVEAAAKAIADCHNPGMFEKYPENWRVEARAALVAAQGAAPQAESDVQDSPVIENRGAEISTQVQPSSTVGVGKIADEMERHRHVMVAPGPHQCSCSFVMSEDPGFSGWAREHKLHVARAVVEAIGCEGR